MKTMRGQLVTNWTYNERKTDAYVTLFLKYYTRTFSA